MTRYSSKASVAELAFGVPYGRSTAHYPAIHFKSTDLLCQVTKSFGLSAATSPANNHANSNQGMR